MRCAMSLLLLTACNPGTSPTRSTAPEVRTTPAVESEPAPDASGCGPANLPDTEAGRRLADLVATVNDPDTTAAEDFVANGMTADIRQDHAQQIVRMRGDGPVITVCRAEPVAADGVLAILQGADLHGAPEYAWFVLSVDDSGKLAALGVTSAVKEDLTRRLESLDPEAVRQVIEGVADGLASYVFADKATEMAKRLRRARDAGEYAAITNGLALALRLTADVRAVTGDKHLRVVYSASLLEPPRGDPTAAEIERFKQRAAQDNFGMPVAEIRDGNVGYLLVVGFLPPEITGNAVAETMSKLADADVLVIDLRQNGGGSPHGVALMTSYLFGRKRVHLNDLYNRSQNHTESFFTNPDVPGRKFGGKKPIYLLTSSATFSAGEEFAYNLKARQRATIVGEVTGGGAHPTDFVRVSEHWAIALPIARAINPVTKTNWEGTGVTPDVDVPAEAALDKALELAGKGRGREG